MTHVLVTGGGRGIGRAICLAALARGWAVSTTLRAGAAAPPGVTAHPLDLDDLSGLPDLAATVGPLDILINNAGILGPPGSAVDPVDPAEMARVFQVNCIAPLAVTQALLPSLRAAASGRGRVLSISSQMAWMGYAKSDHIAYRAAKVALNKVMQGLATDLRPQGIVAVAVDPGWVQTDMGGASAELPAEVVAAGILDLARTLTMDRTGQFLRHDGTARDW